MAKVSKLILPGPLHHQQAVLASSARFNLVRAGRRWGKSRMSLLAALLGWGDKGQRRGAIQGGEILWLCPDYPQSRAIWREEIEPRCKGVLGITVREQERRVEFPGGGALELRSAEAIDGIRGRRLDGVVVDEGAHLDLEYAWTVVLRPALLDRAGWALFPSTPNAGQDGNAAKRAPSYFNVLCAREIRGELGRDWAQFIGKTEDNRSLTEGEVGAMRSEYAGDSLTVRQEIDADLVIGGAGLAFSCWRHEVHVVPLDWEPVQGATFCGGLDFGFRAPGALTVGAVDRDARVVVVDECYFQGLYAEEAGRRIARTCEQWPELGMIAADSAMWAQTGIGPTVAEEVRRGMTEILKDKTPVLFPVIKAGSEGRSSREAGFQLFQRYLAFRAGPDGKVAPWDVPMLRFHPRCANAIRTIPGLPFAPNGNEDVDTDADDHCLAGNTPVLTPAGWIPISALAGARTMRYDAEVITVRDQCGYSLTCTPDHRILTPDGWRAAGDLGRGSTILWYSPPPLKSTVAYATISAVSTSSATECGCIACSGKTPMARCQKDEGGTSTTATTIVPITVWPTSNSFLSRFTFAFTDKWLPRSNAQHDAATPSDLAALAMTACLASSEARRLSGVTSAGRLAKVYDLTVDHPLHAFVAGGGFIAHNCYDSVRYMLSSRPPIPRPLVQAVDANTHPGFDPMTGQRAQRSWERAWQQEVPRVPHFLGNGQRMEEIA